MQRAAATARCFGVARSNNFGLFNCWLVCITTLEYVNMNVMSRLLVSAKTEAGFVPADQVTAERMDWRIWN